MPKRHKPFQDYSRSYQYKLIKLLRENIQNSDDEHSTPSCSEEDETNANSCSYREHQISDDSFNRTNSEELQLDNILNDETGHLNDGDDDGVDNSDSYDDPMVVDEIGEALSINSATDGGNADVSDGNDNDLNSERDSQSTFDYIDDDEFYYNDGTNDDDDEPLYEGAPLTVVESMTSILNLQVRHNLSNALLSDILGLIQLHCPPDNKCKKSLYTFKKFFKDMQMPIIRHYHCVRCNTRLEGQNSDCPICADDARIGYFIEMPLFSQVRALFKRQGFYRALQYRFTRGCRNFESYDDIYDGSSYRELFENNGVLSSAVNFSMTWYTDGIRIFKSSKFAIWPVYLVINELPFAERMKKENVLLVALWFGEGKPVPNLFLEPLCPSFRELSEGIEVYITDLRCSLQSKGIVMCGTCDLPAKALFLNMKQYNGKFGCQKCKQEGVYLKESRVRVYPFERFELRTDAETQLHAQEALDTGEAVYGVKGPTVLSDIVCHNMRAIAIDTMHCVFEGVVKNLLSFWFSPKHSDHPSSIIRHINLVDDRLASFTPPSSVQRLPRSIKNHLPYWKAHELKTWFFYYSVPCISDIMAKVYFNHYKLLLLGVTLLSRSSISLNTLDIASRAFNEFVSMFEHLYFKRNMTNNLHQLLHLVENVRQFGPLWTTSCFPFEDLNGKLKNLVHGSNGAQLQIHTAVSQYMTLGTLKSERLPEGQPAALYCEKMDYKSGRLKRYAVAESTYIIGKCEKISELPQDIKRILERSSISIENIYFFNKLLIRKSLFTSTGIQRNQRTNSTYALYSGVNSSQIGRIRCFIRAPNCLCHTLCSCEAEMYAILRPCLVENEFLTCIDNTSLSMVHTFLGFKTKDRAIPVQNLKKICFYLKVRNTSQSYIIEPVNSVEFE